MKDNPEIHMGSLPTTERSVAVKEEFSENDCRKEKKARVSKSEGKESSASKGRGGRTDKKSSHTKNQQRGKDLSSRLTQRSRNGLDSLKKDLGSAQVSVAATSSSSKVSGSQRTKSSFQEVKGSPVESVSSSPMRILNPDKHESVLRDLRGKDESQDAGRFALGSPRRCSDGEDDGRSDRSGTARKEKFSSGAYHRSESSVLDVQDRDFSHISGGKARGQIVASPDITNNFPMNGALDNSGPHTRSPSKPLTSNQLAGVDREMAAIIMLTGLAQEIQEREKFVNKYGENENKYVSKKDFTGKSLNESSKREGQSNFGGHDDPDVRLDAIYPKDAISTPKKLQDCDSERSSKRIPSERTDRVDTGSIRGKSVPLPPSGGAQNEMMTRCPRPASASHKGNGADILHVDGLKVMMCSRLSGSTESTGLYFEAVLKFLHAASLLESSNTESAKQNESMRMYRSTAGTMPVIYSSHSIASRDRHELQTALQMVPPGESPSSSASDLTPSCWNHAIAARNRPNFVRILNFTQDVNNAMEASKKSRLAFAAADTNTGEAKYSEGISSIKRALDFNFQDVEGLLRLVRLAMEAFSR
ncbi:hypothetical protein M0R45_011115 [Rubus argutus]|uniref:CWZF3/5/7 THD domain-containing protein n=1 Tax=Rubus argutus TaxID=59490 RepID=A0AAW1YA97_RUBAR